jgi:hypothetical protein
MLVRTRYASLTQLLLLYVLEFANIIINNFF